MHWMGCWQGMVGATKGTPLYNLFMSMTSDALFIRLKGEYDDVLFHLKQLKGMTDDKIKAVSRKYWRKMCRVTCPEPAVLLRALYDLCVPRSNRRRPCSKER